MKTCDEMMHSLLERREQYVAAQRKKNRMLAGAAASLCVVALVGVTVWQGGDWLTQSAPIKVADTTTGGTIVTAAPSATIGGDTTVATAATDAPTQTTTPTEAQHLQALPCGDRLR